jgi:molecular chaperone Hsp33
MDKLIKAMAPETKIRIASVDVTMTAKALEARHLAGPTAAMALAEGIAAVALLSMDAAGDDEAMMLRVTANGPIGGMMVESMGDGGLRGFTNTKVLNEFDVLDAISTEGAWGTSGSIQILTSLPGKILNQAALNVNPPNMKFVLARYFNHSMQVPTACEIFVRADSGGIIEARGILVQRMEDSDQEAFVRVLESFEGGTVREQLSKTSDCEAFKDVFGLSDIETRDTRELMFKCRCTKPRTLAVLKTLTRDEVEKLIASGESQVVTCHMCGDNHMAATDDLRAILAEMPEDEK